ncbi:MAG TPA: LuxR C-terminal-related transcriptional regulator [Thermopolyspora sp.]
METDPTSTTEGRHRFAGMLQRALTLEEVSDAYMRVATSVIPASGLGLYRLSPDARQVLRVHADVSGDFLDEYEDYGRADDPVLDFVVEQRRPIDSTRVVSPSRWASSGARSAIGVGGYFHSMEAPILVSGVLYGTMNFSRTQDEPAFSEADLVSARLAGEQLGLATERALRFEATGQRTNLLEHTLDRVPQAVVVTDLDAQILFRNRAARDLDAQGGSDPIICSIAEAMAEFRSSTKRVRTHSVRDTKSDRRAIVKSFRLPDRHDAAVTLVFNCADEKASRLPAWDVLSRREQEIAALVAQGLTTKQIAERAFVSENTVKQHLKRVFAKTDVHNRAELVQLIWSADSGGGAPGHYPAG